MARIYISTTIVGGDNMHKYSRVLLIGFVTILFSFLVGCFQGEQTLEEVDPPREAEAVDSFEDASKGNEEGNTESNAESNAEVNEVDNSTQTVARQLYLMDINGMIAAQTLELPLLESKEVATQVLEYLVKNGPVTPILPNGFQAILPEGTEILGLNLREDGTLIVDVSKEFENYESNDELKILEAMTFTLTQFDNVDQIELWINGYPQEEMPVNGTPISGGYSRVNGINLIKTDTIDLMNSQAVTMYYPSEYNDNRYYIPVTQHINTTKADDMYRSIVQALIKGPGYNYNVTDVFNDRTLLVEEPKLEKGVLKLTFNEDILKDIDKAVISDEVMETLVRTLTEQLSVESIDVKVINIDLLSNENGEPYVEPVSNKVYNNAERL